MRNSFITIVILLIGIVTSLVLYLIFAYPIVNPVTASFNYEDIEYSDLVSRGMSFSVARTIQNIPDRNCFAITEHNKEEFPAEVIDSISEADRNFEEDEKNLPSSEIGAVVYSDSTVQDVDNVEALEILKKYNFNSTIEATRQNFRQIQDNAYIFECFFEYNENQYWAQIYFDTYYPRYVRFVTVNFTSSDDGRPTILNPEIVVSSGDVNATVLFINKLDLEVTLEYENPLIAMEENDGSRISERIIPAGKMLQVSYGRDVLDEQPQDGPSARTYSYTVMPYGLQGTITKRPHPMCINDINEAKSYYSPDGAELKFPTYLPEGYSLRCGIHGSNYVFYAAYLPADRDYDNGLADEFLSQGGIWIDYTNYLILNGWDESNILYNKSEIPISYGNNSEHQVEYIDDNPVILGSRSAYWNGTEYAINTLKLFQDKDSYYIQGMLTHEELMKIARSLK